MPETNNAGPYVNVFTTKESRPLLKLDLTSDHVLIDGIPLNQYIEQQVAGLLGRWATASFVGDLLATGKWVYAGQIHAEKFFPESAPTQELDITSIAKQVADIIKNR